MLFLTEYRLELKRLLVPVQNKPSLNLLIEQNDVLQSQPKGNSRTGSFQQFLSKKAAPFSLPSSNKISRTEQINKAKKLRNTKSA